MPMGSFHAETGVLRYIGHGLYALERDEGGTWRLDLWIGPPRLVGRRVHIEGTRAGFDLLNVDHVWAEGTPRPATLRERIACWMRGKKQAV